MNSHSAQWSRPGSIAMYIVSTVVTWYQWAGGFLDWSKWSGLRVTLNDMTMESLQVGVHRLWFDLERDALCEVYLPEAHSVWVNTSPVFKLDIWKELVRCSDGQWLSVMGLMMMIHKLVYSYKRSSKDYQDCLPDKEVDELKMTLEQ